MGEVISGSNPNLNLNSRMTESAQNHSALRVELKYKCSFTSESLYMNGQMRKKEELALASGIQSRI